MKKLFIVATVLLTSACGNSERNNTVANTRPLNDLREDGLLGSVKKKTIHISSPIYKNGEWMSDGKTTYTAVTYYNKDGFATLTETSSYENGKRTESGKSVTEFRDGLPVLRKHYEGNNVSGTYLITYLNNNSYKTKYQDNPAIERITELRDKNLLVSTLIQSDEKLGLTGTTIHNTKYNEKGIIYEQNFKTTITVNGEPADGADNESVTKSEVISYDKKGNITKELMTTHEQDRAYSEFRVKEYEYYE